MDSDVVFSVVLGVAVVILVSWVVDTDVVDSVDFSFVFSVLLEVVTDV